MQERITAEKARLASTRVAEDSPVAAAAAAACAQPVVRSTTLEELLRRPHVHYPTLAAHGCGGAEDLTAGEAECAEIDIKYAGFIQRQERQLEQMAGKASRLIPEDVDYAAISTLSMEAREKLAKIRPRDIGQAGRIGGVSPADVSALLLHLEVLRRKRAASAAAGGAAEDVQQRNSAVLAAGLATKPAAALAAVVM